LRAGVMKRRGNGHSERVRADDECAARHAEAPAHEGAVRIPQMGAVEANRSHGVEPLKLHGAAAVECAQLGPVEVEARAVSPVRLGHPRESQLVVAVERIALEHACLEERLVHHAGHAGRHLPSCVRY
jgi:hypothetical protein